MSTRPRSVFVPKQPLLFPSSGHHHMGSIALLTPYSCDLLQSGVEQLVLGLYIVRGDNVWVPIMLTVALSIVPGDTTSC